MASGAAGAGVRLWALATLLPSYVRLAWWGLVSPRRERVTLVVVQAVIRDERGLLLSVRSDLRGWELPGGNLRSGEDERRALVREVREETGLDVEPVQLIGVYERTGFRPHAAHVYACRLVGGSLRPSRETPRLGWFVPDALPDTLFPWYRAPIADALAGVGQPVRRREHQGVAAILAGMRIDLRMRASADRAGEGAGQGGGRRPADPGA